MGLLSKFNKVARSVGVSGFHGFDSVKDALKHLPTDEVAGALGTMLHAFKRTQAVSTPVVVKTNQGPVTTRDTAKAFGVRTQPMAADQRFLSGTEAIESFVGDVAGAKRVATSTIDDLLEKPVSHIPEPLRHAIDNTANFVADSFTEPIGTVMRGANTAYDKGVSQPLSFLVIASELRADPEYMKSLEGKSFWEQQKEIKNASWQAARHTSPGRAIGYALFGGDHADITDQATIDKIVNHPLFNDVSGSIDAVTRVGLDPVALGARGLKAANEAIKVRETWNFATEAPDAINTVAGRKLGVDKLFDKVRSQGEAAQTLEQFFPSRNADNGVDWSNVLHDAAHVDDVDMAKERFNLVLRAGLGNEDAKQILINEYATLADDTLRLQLQHEAITGIVTPDPNNPLNRWITTAPSSPPGYDEFLTQIIEEQASAAARAERTMNLSGSLRRAPTVTMRNQLRSGVVRSEFYQTTRFGRTLRVFADINPASMVSLHADDIDKQLNRFLVNAEMPIAEREAFRSRMMSPDLSNSGRAALIDEAEDRVIQLAADKTGLPFDQLKERITKERSDFAKKIDTESVYDTTTDTTRLTVVNLAGDVDELSFPLHPTQFVDYKSIPDGKKIAKIANQLAGRFGPADWATDAASDALNRFHSIWKPTVLFGTRTPIRIIGEEHIRTMSKFGALATLMGDARQIGGKVSDVVTRASKDDRLIPPVARRDVIGVGGVSMGHGLVDELGGPTMMSRLLDQTAGGVRSYGAAEAVERAAILRTTKEWKALTGTDPGHIEAWVNDVNNQIRRNPVASQLLANDGDIEATVAWLHDTETGRKAMRYNRISARDPEGWAMRVEDQLDRYLPTPELREIAKNGPVRGKMLEDVFPDPATRPNVHGQLLEEMVGDGSGWKHIHQKIDNLVDNLSTKPDIFLSRQNHFDLAYRQEIMRQRSIAEAQGVTHWDDADIARVRANASTHALHEVRETLYDLAEYSRFAEVFRFAAPFANATREVLTTWAGITIDNPAFVRRMQILWQSPERAGVIYDSAGNQVHADGTATSPTGETVKPSSGRYFHVELPEYIDHAPVLGTVIPKRVTINKESFNTILANPLGVSPLVQIAAGRLTNDPKVETFLKPFFPYGIDHSVISPLLPSAVRVLTNKKQHEDMTFRFLMDDIVKYELNDRQGEVPTIAKARKKMEVNMGVQVLASLTIPTSVKYQSPYQPWIDIFKEMQKTDPENATTDFIDQYGEELFGLTETMGKSLDHVPPTLEGMRKRQEWKGFIEKYPEFGGVAVGPVSDEFNSAVYADQGRSDIGPNDDRNQRGRMSLYEASRQPHVDAGWYAFQKGMALIEATRIERGLPNLRVRGARDLAQMKKDFIAELSDQYKEWGEEYGQVDAKAAAKKITAFTELVGIASGARPDAKGLVKAGNIDLTQRPVVKNDDGTISTVRSITITDKGKAVLLPTVSDDGEILSNKDAIAAYRRTGKNLGVFDSERNADAYARGLHKAQEAFYTGTRGDLRGLASYLNFRKVFVAALTRRAGSRRGSSQLDSASNQDLLEKWETGIGLLKQESPAFSLLFDRYLDRDTPEGVASR